MVWIQFEIFFNKWVFYLHNVGVVGGVDGGGGGGVKHYHFV